MKLMNVITLVVASMCIGILIGYNAGMPNYTYRAVLIDKNYRVIGEAYLPAKSIEPGVFSELPVVRDDRSDTAFRPLFVGITKIKP